MNALITTTINNISTAFGLAVLSWNRNTAVKRQ